MHESGDNVKRLMHDIKLLPFSSSSFPLLLSSFFLSSSVIIIIVFVVFVCFFVVNLDNVKSLCPP